MGASAGKAVARPGRGAPTAPTRFARYPEVGGHDVSSQKPTPGPCLPSPSWSWCLFCGEIERPLFLFSALGEEGTARFGVGRACFPSSN